MRRLVPPNVKITFKPSERQYEVWNALQPNRCDKCGGKLRMVETGVDANGNKLYAPQCEDCGNFDIPERVLGGGAAGGGKMLSINSCIATPYGFRPLLKLQVGDIISNPITGGIQHVIQIHPKGVYPFYRIHFVDGTHTDCSEGHLWRLHKSRGKTKLAKKYPERFAEYGDDRIWETKAIYKWYQDKKNGMYKGTSLIIPLTAPVQFTVNGNGKKRIIDPYILGALIGDGCISDGCIKNGYVVLTTMDQEIVDRFIKAGYDMSHSHQKDTSRAREYYIHDKTLCDELKRLKIAGNLSKTHFIPQLYKYGKIDERIALMQGLMDTDGYVDDRGHMSYTSISKQLAEDVAFIVRSLGGVATVTTNPAGYRDPHTGEFIQCNDTWDVQIRTKMNPDLVGLTRKKKRAKYEFNGGVSELGKRITDVEYIGEQESFCITVDDPSGLYIVDNFTVTHNSYLGCAWLTWSCMMFPNVFFAVCRKELKNLQSTTWKTLLRLLKEWGLVEEENYHVNEVAGTVKFWNGSTIQRLALATVPSDPEFNWLGSLEITGAFVDEAAEVDEKAIEVLSSRIRYRVAETFVVGKIFMCCNPTMGWIRPTFVQDENGDPAVLRKGDRYIPFSLFDNPNESFRAVYYNKLKQIRDKVTRNRLLYGNWDSVAGNDMAAYWNYDGDKHLFGGLKEKKFDPSKPLCLLLDFNVNPYMTCIPMQFNYERKEVYVLPEIIGKPASSKDNTPAYNNTPAFSRLIAKTLLKERHIGGIILSGDPAGMARSTQTEEGVNNFTIAAKTLRESGFRAETKVLSRQPNMVTRLEFINEMLAGYDGWKIMIDLRCRKLSEDMTYQRKNPDGTKEKKKVLDETGGKSEKYGHASDCLDYGLCYFCSDEYVKYKSSSNVPKIFTVDNYTNGATTIYDSFAY